MSGAPCILSAFYQADGALWSFEYQPSSLWPCAPEGTRCDRLLNSIKYSRGTNNGWDLGGRLRAAFKMDGAPDNAILSDFYHEDGAL